MHRPIDLENDPRRASRQERGGAKNARRESRAQERPKHAA